ncbi:hypothetical protein BaRGS_00005337, partial [Batillaria attramentaria]
MGDENGFKVLKSELAEKESVIRQQSERIRDLESELERVKRERDDLFRKFADPSSTSPGDATATDESFRDTLATGRPGRIDNKRYRWQVLFPRANATSPDHISPPTATRARAAFVDRDIVHLDIAVNGSVPGTDVSDCYFSFLGGRFAGPVHVEPWSEGAKGCEKFRFSLSNGMASLVWAAGDDGPLVQTQAVACGLCDAYVIDIVGRCYGRLVTLVPTHRGQFLLRRFVSEAGQLCGHTAAVNCQTGRQPDLASVSAAGLRLCSS